MEDKLLVINKMVNESLQFAEAKNAALITFNGAALYVLIEGQNYLPTLIQDNITVISGMLVMAISISLIAFLPIMNPRPIPTKKEIKHRNLLKNSISTFYFGHIRLFDAHTLLKVLYKNYHQKVPQKFIEAEVDLAAQNIMICRITWRKYLFFSIAGHLTLASIILPIPFLILYWIINFAKKR